MGEAQPLPFMPYFSFFKIILTICYFKDNILIGVKMHSNGINLFTYTRVKEPKFSFSVRLEHTLLSHLSKHPLASGFLSDQLEVAYWQGNPNQMDITWALPSGKSISRIFDDAFDCKLAMDQLLRRRAEQISDGVMKALLGTFEYLLPTQAEYKCWVPTIQPAAIEKVVEVVEDKQFLYDDVEHTSMWRKEFGIKEMAQRLIRESRLDEAITAPFYKGRSKIRTIVVGPPMMSSEVPKEDDWYFIPTMDIRMSSHCFVLLDVIITEVEDPLTPKYLYHPLRFGFTPFIDKVTIVKEKTLVLEHSFLPIVNLPVMGKITFNEDIFTPPIPTHE